ncbi:hypothetical protein [Nocardia stercoris]|uniref:hypothetical protein n=1 Tax=Nocardia stercoris TaxID=2483361 RepID=UPI0011C38BA4|nr:hypothetical protein [Nocardia stercoris]
MHTLETWHGRASFVPALVTAAIVARHRHCLLANSARTAAHWLPIGGAWSVESDPVVARVTSPRNKDVPIRAGIPRRTHRARNRQSRETLLPIPCL